ncbi:hypothetical protein [Clostridium sp.]|uniref:hypothetical protein n=1 Tax=Clostridium sp. TaxID=1506 RepID=UPI0026060EB1|nr:hypothetical protein [Clostridium sp.]
MCNCLKEKEELLRESLAKSDNYKDKKIKDIDIGPMGFFLKGNKIVSETVSDVNITLEYKNKKGELKEKKVKTGLTHAYCPWCGKSYREAKENGKDNVES